MTNRTVSNEPIASNAKRLLWAGFLAILFVVRGLLTKTLSTETARALNRMARELDAGSVLVSATNGKTTTAAMIAASTPL